MKLFDNGYIKLEYDTDTQVLIAPCPDIEHLNLMLVHKAFTQVVQSITEHHIHKLLLDASDSKIDVSVDDHRLVVDQFVEDLKTSPLKQLARIISANKEHEESLAIYLNEKQAKSPLPFEVKNFKTKAEALSWLEYTTAKFP